MKKSKRMTKEEKAELRCQMEQMVNEANALRDEAAEKMYDIPKGYKLNRVRDDIYIWLAMIMGVAICVGFLALFQWSLEVEDAIHYIVAFACTAALGVGFIWAGASRNRPYKIEEHVEDYYVNEGHYKALAKELKRLKEGIADYDRQYEERKEYIQKFSDFYPEVDDYGSLHLVLKANDFHAHVKMATATDEVDCRLGLDQGGYTQLKNIVDFFNKSA